MMNRDLVQRIYSEDGFKYQAKDAAGPFMDALNTTYNKKLKERAFWVASNFDNTPTEKLKKIQQLFFHRGKFIW